MLKITPKLTVILLASLLALNLLTACSQTATLDLNETVVARLIPGTGQALATIPADSGTPQAPATPAPELTPTEALQPTPTPRLVNVDPAHLSGQEVTFWHLWGGSAYLNTVIQSLVSQFNQSNEWGIQVRALAHNGPDELEANTQAALQNTQGALQGSEDAVAGETPDLIAAFPFQALAWDQERELADLNDYINDPQWGLSAADQADFYPVFWDATTNGDIRPGLPAQASGRLLFYNQSWAEELGFSDLPTTPDGLRQQACAAAQANRQDADPNNDGTGGLVLSTDYSAVLGWIEAFGGQVFQDGDQSSTKKPYDFDNPGVEKAFTFLRQLYDQGCAWLPEGDSLEAALANRDGLLAPISLSNLPYLDAAMDKAGNRDRWTLLPFPSPDGQPAISAYGPSYFIFKSTPEHQLAAWLFARWLLSPENQARLVEAGEGFPLRAATMNYLGEYQQAHPRWVSALDTLPYAHAEPPYPSWNIVRWAVSDAATQLFRSYFTIDQVGDLIKFLDQTAADLD